MDVSSIIKSRDVRDHIRQTGYQLPDRDAATILSMPDSLTRGLRVC